LEAFVFRFLPQSARGARTLLTVVWVGFFLMNLSIILYVYQRGWIERDNFILGAKQLSDLYAPYVGGITIFHWSTKTEHSGIVSRRSRTGFFLAFYVSLFWNGLLVAFLVPLALGHGDVTAALENTKDIGGMLSWLVGGAVGFYFGGPATSGGSV